MTLLPGTKLGPYEIVASIGAGGMGEVYRARDNRLGRDIAVKILPESFARDQDRLRRFEQETRSVAALNHPNILAIYDVGQHGSAPFLVSELLEGESLRALLDGGALPQRKAIEYGVQVAQGLAAAHDKGIVHRDLKPENLFVSKDGRVKILDFGLAKLAAKSDASNSDGITMTGSHTAAGVVMGTASYMAPEQVRAQNVDARTDIFAFGAVLFEMLSGRRAFRRDTPAETMTAVLKEDPPEIASLSQPVSPALDRIVRRCLEKNPEQRFQSAKDLSFALSSLSGTDASSTARAIQLPVRRSPWLWVSAGLALVALAAILWAVAKHPVAAERQQFAIPVPGEVSLMALSSDGRMLAFISPDEKTAIPMLYVQRVGSSTATELPGTAGASYPFWSPDDEYVAFFANGKLQKQALSGGAPQMLASVSSARGGSWGKKNVIVYSPEASGWLWSINADGSAAGPLTAKIVGKGEQSHRWPLFFPDGDHFLFWSGNFNNNQGDADIGIYVSSLAATGKKMIAPARSNVASLGGQLLYVDDKRQLITMPFDGSKAAVFGEPTVIANAVGFQPSTYWGAFTGALNGTVIFNSETEITRSALTWVDRTGKEVGRVREPGVLSNPSISPDGEQVAVDVSDLKANNVDIWIESLKGGSNQRFTFDPSEEVDGVWSRDGKTIAYRSAANSARLMLKPASGLVREVPILSLQVGGEILPNSWTVDDKQILCTTVSGGRPSDLVLVPASGGKAIPFLNSKFAETNGQISPDGRWVAYASNESGDWEIYVTSFPGAGGKWQVSRGGGSEPRWRRDGKEIFYITPTGMLTAVSVVGGDAFTTGTPAPLFQLRSRTTISSTDLYTYDVARDGTRFLVNRYIKPEHIKPLTIVLNAAAEAAR
jgi:Tol biopolymer transport system component